MTAKERNSQAAAGVGTLRACLRANDNKNATAQQTGTREGGWMGAVEGRRMAAGVGRGAERLLES